VKRPLAALAAVLVALTCVHACELVYFIDPIETQIVEQGSGSPIEGAMVVAYWRAVTVGFHNETFSRVLEVHEAVTGSGGFVRFDGFTKVNLQPGGLTYDDPRLIVFKPGYEIGSFSGLGTEHGSHRTARYLKNPLRLSPVTPRSSSLYSTAGNALGELIQDCHWTQIPMMMAALDTEQRPLESTKSGASIGLITVAERSKRCH
jgi:hypothetical protein